MARNHKKAVTSEAVPYVPPEPVGRPDMADWTFMFYLAGDNNLSDEMVWALKEVYRVGLPACVNVTVQLDTMGPGAGARFYRPSAPVDVDGVFPLFHDSEQAEVDSSDPLTLVQFVLRSVREAPARHYMLILAGHGSGIVGDFLTDQDTDRRREIQPGSLTIPDLRLVFSKLREMLPPEFLDERPAMVDVLGMDSCLMSMAEICSEVAGHASILVGSEGFDPNTGWPYFRLLEKLSAATAAGLPLPGPSGLARRLVARYAAYYSDFVDAGLSVDISACDVSRRAVDALEAAVKRFAEYYRAQPRDASGRWIDLPVVQAHWKAQSYKGEQYTDLWDFADLLCQECDALIAQSEAQYRDRYKMLKEHAWAIRKAIASGNGQGMVFASEVSGPDFQHSRGLSVYFPWSRACFDHEYTNTAFAMRTGWSAFLESYFDRTQRPARSHASARRSQTKRAPDPSEPSLTVTLDELEEEGRAVETRFESAVSADLRVSAPSSRTSAPSSRTSAPSSRTSAPSSRTSAPSSRTSAPSSRVSAPSSRFAQQMDAMLNTLPARMKNAPTGFERIIRVEPDDVGKLGPLPDSRALRGLRVLAASADQGTAPAHGKR